jgi:hypothetical protein
MNLSPQTSQSLCERSMIGAMLRFWSPRAKKPLPLREDAERPFRTDTPKPAGRPDFAFTPIDVGNYA